MHERTNHLFSVSQVIHYDETARQTAEKYRYSFFGGDVLNSSEKEIEEFFDNAINILNSKREFIRKLRGTSLDVIKDDIGSSAYEILKHGGISNVYELRMKLHLGAFERIYSCVPGIGPTKGKKIIEALKKHGLYTNIYVDYL